MSDNLDRLVPPPSHKPNDLNVHKFQRVLDRLVPPGEKVGLAVSGGADSMALLLLAAAARPGLVEAATVDHQLRAGSAREAKMVADLCRELDVPHATLTIDWGGKKPTTRIQELARLRRYGALADWAKERGLKYLATAHHADDQAETLLMRLNRGAGVIGLSGMRSSVTVPGSDEALVRPLLSVERSALEKMCEAAYVEPFHDPSNDDDRFERVRVRKGLAEADWLDSWSVALSASHLNEADQALRFYANRAYKETVRKDGAGAYIDVEGLPREIRRRVLGRLVDELATEARDKDLRGRDVERAMRMIEGGKSTTLRGLRLVGGKVWTVSPAPARTPVG